MQYVIKALTEKQHALLESPTGTGKTLSLLCASLGWLNTEREKHRILNIPMPSIKIIYSSRTHSQLDQVKRELMNTAYSPKSVSLASRDHLCVHEMKQRYSGEKLNKKCRIIKYEC
jgi:regulator of telomere elongation helicase 1